MFKQTGTSAAGAISLFIVAQVLLGYRSLRRTAVDILLLPAEVRQRRNKNLKAPWDIVGNYIRTNSDPTDKIYVWG